MTGGGAAIDNGRPGHTQAEQCLLITHGLVRCPGSGWETGTGPDKGCTGVRGSRAAITNDCEEPPYVLTLTRR